MALGLPLLGKAVRQLSLAACGVVCRALPPPSPQPPGAQVMGLSFRNRIGVAAGFDRCGRLGRRLGRLGFGHVEVGTVTLAGQPGRSAGLDEVMRRWPASAPADAATMLGAVVAARDGLTPDAAATEILICLTALAPLVDYLSLSLCGRGGGLRWPATYAQAVLEALAAGGVADDPWRRPLVVKLPGGMGALPLVRSAAAAGAAAVVAEHAPPEEIRRWGAVLPVVAVGGVRGPADIDARLAAGAVLVQVCRPLMTRGPLAAGLCRA